METEKAPNTHTNIYKQVEDGKDERTHINQVQWTLRIQSTAEKTKTRKSEREKRMSTF